MVGLGGAEGVVIGARNTATRGSPPPEIAKLLGVSRATVYRYLALLADEANG